MRATQEHGMPRKQRFKPSRKPKQVEPATESTMTRNLARDHATMQSASSDTGMPPPRGEGSSASGGES
jgi:hypothetical protein